MIDIIRRIRNNLELRCPIVCIPEAMTGHSASKIAADIEEANLPGIVVMSERAGYLEGVTKDDKITFEYYSELEKAMRSGCLTFWDRLITTWNDRKQHQRTPLKDKQKLGIMCQNLRMVPLNKNLEHGDMRYKITAKIGQAQDDILIALMMCLYWRGVFWRDQVKVPPLIPFRPESTATGKRSSWRDRTSASHFKQTSR